MKIKDYKCKCGRNDFFFADKGNQKGIYCTNCGKWLKWADKDEQNLIMKQAPTEWEKDHEVLKAYSNGANEVLDKIRAEIEALEEGITSYHKDRPWIYKDEVLQIFDKYKDKSESEET